MSNQYLKLRRSAVPGKTPTTESIDFGEIALNTYDGLAFMKKSGSNGEEVVTIGASTGSFTGSFNGEFSGSFSGSGADLFNIPASGIVGLNLSQIASGSATASIAPDTGLQINVNTAITGSNGKILLTPTVSNPNLAIQEIHANDEYPWIARFYNDSFSNTNSVMSYFGWNDGKFVFHNDSTQSIGLQVNGYEAQNGLLVHEDKVAFVNNVEITGSISIGDNIDNRSNIIFANTSSIITYTDGYTTFKGATGSNAGISLQSSNGRTYIEAYPDNAYISTTNQNDEYLQWAFTSSGSLRLPISGANAILNPDSTPWTASYALTSSYVTLAQTASYVSGAVQLTITEDPGGTIIDSSFLFVSASDDGVGYEYWYRNKGVLWNQNWIEDLTDTGIIYGGVVTFSGTDILVTPGAGLIINHNAVTSSHVSPEPQYVSWGPITASATFITSSQVTYLYIDQFGSLQQQTTAFTVDQFHEKLPLGLISSFTTSSIDSFSGIRTTTYGQNEQASAFMRSFGPLKINGFDLQPQTGSLKLTIASGTGYRQGGFYSVDPETPSTFESVAVPTGSFVRIHKDPSAAGGFISDANGNSYYTDIDPTKWDDGTGILQNVSASQWSIQRVFYSPLEQIAYAYYGQNVYANLSLALQSTITEQFIEAKSTQESLVFIGYIVAKGDTTNLSDTANNKILQAGLYRNTAGSSGGGGATATYLNDLADVETVAPTTGQALVYNAGLWENGTPLSAISASYSQTASYVNPLHQDVVITGSVKILDSAASLQIVGNGFGQSSLISPNGALVLTPGIYGVQINGAFPDLTVNGNITTNGYLASKAAGSYLTGSLQGTASWANNAVTSSYVLQAVSASYSQTASYVNPLRQDVIITGSLTVSGSQVPFQIVSASTSIIYVSSSGGVGIGKINSTPSVMLDVDGNIRSGAQLSGAQVRTNYILPNTNNLQFSSGSANTPLTTVAATMFTGSGNWVYQAAQGATDLGYKIAINSSGVSGSLYVSGSTVMSGSLKVIQGITGSLFGTASWASNAITSSYAQTASFALTASYQYPIAVTGSTLRSVSPAGGSGASANNSIFLGNDAGTSASSANYSNFLGQSAGYQASSANNSHFLGWQAGFAATNANASNFIGTNAGYSATNASNSNFLGSNAGYLAIYASYSNFLGTSAGFNAYSASFSNFLGNNAGQNATNANQSNFLGYQAGRSATNAGNSNFLGVQAGDGATNANNSNFIGSIAGYQATNAYQSNFIGNGAGNIATNAYYSNFFGTSAGYSALNASWSNFLGYQAGYQATNAYYSNFLGYTTGFNAYSASHSNFLGWQAGYGATGAQYSNFLGWNAGQGATGANNSNFLGQSAGNSATSAYYSNFLGQSAGYAATNAYSSNFLGQSAGQYATNADHSNFLGNQAGYQATSANQSNFIGLAAGYAATYANNSNFFGYQAGNGAYNAAQSHFLGYQAGYYATDAYYSTFIGQYAGSNANTAPYSNFLGFYAGTSAQNANNSNFLGQYSGYQAGSAYHSNFLGASAGQNAANAYQSNFLGNGAGYYATYAQYSNFLGREAGYQATNASNSNFLGNGAGFQATNAAQSNFLGQSAGNTAINSYNSNFLGYQAGYQATNADHSNFIGRDAGNNATSALQSNFIGSYTGYQATNAYYSNFIGSNAGRGAYNASYSTLIGYNVGSDDNGYIGSNNIIIGTNISLPDGTQDAINLGGVIFATNTHSDTGTQSTSAANGKVGINKVTPTHNFEVNGTVAFTALPTTTQTNVVGINTSTGELTIQPGSSAFLKSKTPATTTTTIADYDSIFNPSNLLVQDTSVFIIDSTSYYYVLGDLINSGSMVIDGTLKIGGTLYNVGTITGTGSII